MKIIAFILALLLLCCGCSEPAPVTVPIEPPYTLPVSPYVPEDFIYAGDYLSCAAGETVMGIDVSSHQGEIDWQEVAASGVKFAFIRLGYRGYNSGTLHVDEFAQRNLNAARAAGIQIGAYFFSQAVTVEEAEEEARQAVEILDHLALDLPLVYDWEYVSETARTANVDRRLLTDCTLAFCTGVEKAGYAPMVYFNSSQITDLLYGEELEQYPWWLAKYDPAMAFPCRVDMWQYTNQGAVPGINGDVDINLMFTEYGLGMELFGVTK